MSHSARQSERENMQKFIDDSMDDLMIKTDMEKQDVFNDAIYAGKIEIDDVLEIFEQQLMEYYGSHWRPR